MATVQGLTAARMLEIEGASVVDGNIDGSGHLILITHGGTEIDAGSAVLAVVDATTSAKGVVELATNGETTTGTDTVRAVTPAGVAAVAATLQPLDSDLTAIAALTPTNNDVVQRKSGAWTNRSMSQLATDLLATGLFTGGGGGSTYVPFLTVGPTGSGASLETDGTADEVQINAALSALTNGGVVLLAPGTYNLAASITFTGTDAYSGPTKALIGAGMHSTILVAASNIHAISITAAASCVIKNMEIRVVGTGSGIVSTRKAGTPALYQAFWNSLFENLYFSKNGGSAHTGWAMNLGSPFRSRFANLEVFGLHNGFRLYSEDAEFNPGDCTFDRVFIETDSTSGSVGLHLESANSKGSLNQVTFNMFELIDNAAGGTGILLNGTGGSGSNHHMFTGINIEQFATVLNVTTGFGNRFDFNYVESLAAGTFFQFGSGSGGNHIRSVGFGYVGTKTNTYINDGCTNLNEPNTFENCHIGVDSGGTANLTSTSATRILGTKGYNSGTLASGLNFQVYPWTPKAPVVLTDAATIATNAALSNHFRVTLGGNRTLGVPTNPVDGQKAVWEIIQDGTGSRTLSLTTGSSGAFKFGADITSITLSTAAGARDLLGAIYSSSLSRWCVVAFTKGF